MDTYIPSFLFKIEIFDKKIFIKIDKIDKKYKF